MPRKKRTQRRKKQPLSLRPKQVDLKKALINSLKGAKKVAVLGVGSELRGDDIAGMVAAEIILKAGNKKIGVFLGATAPENLTGEIKKFEPSHLFIIDAADTASKPGTISLISPDIVGGISFSTHMMPLKIMVDYMFQSIKCKTMIIGIQPGVLKFGSSPSKAAMDSAREVAKIMLEVVR
jgi:hydrogenase 3 maturation protease